MARSFTIALAMAALSYPAGAFALDLPGPLVTTEWLARNQDSVRVLDVRNDPTSFKEGGHIIGSVRVDYKNLRGVMPEAGVPVDGMSVSPEAFQDVMRKAGVSVDQPIVLTHRSRGPDDVGLATYLYWQLKRYGHDNVAILDGGTTKWIAESREVWGDDDEVQPGNFVVRPERTELVTGTPAVEQTLQSKNLTLLDARLFEFFVGIEKRPNILKFGHIPGAASFPFNANLNPDLTFRNKDQLAAAMTSVGFNPNQPVITYCNTGHVASISWFVIHELLGYKSASLYDGSMLAWTKHGHDAQSTIPR
ncbi:rhodanese-like domain-containing protein [Hyphomicrobium methylovorum]|uniref:rhodanese-like domain-containing protein n=1 Tax=Hyphomicrobium methylovorum TaxID=84 RepID=UPI0015E68CF2